MRTGRTCILLFLLSLPALDARPFAQPERFPARLRAVSPEEDLGAAMVLAAAAARTASTELRTGPLSARQRAALTQQLDRIRANDLLIRTGHEDLQRSIKVGGIVPIRLADAAASYRTRVAPVRAAIAQIDESLEANDDGGLRGALDVLARELDTLITPEERTPLGVALPFRSLHLPPVAPSVAPSIVPAYSDGRFRQTDETDVQASPDAELRAEIVEQARTLGNDPIAIYEFVRNEIDIEFYHGAIKGAAETLRQKRGNDLDQASLLIALMRASAVPARYVRGVVALTGAQALGWTGLSSTQRAAELFAAAGIPFRSVIQGGTIGAFEIDHSWVEVAVPYSNYRGARISPDARDWIPLDASFKSSTYAPGTDLLDDPSLSGETLVSEYLSTLQPLSPLDFVKQRLEAVLSRTQGSVPYSQAIGARTLLPERLGLLPNTLPYGVVSVRDERAAVDDSLRHRIRFIARTLEGPAFDVTIPTSEIVGRRVTLSYVPDSVDDQMAIDAFLGLDNTPAYLVRLRPVLRVGGVIRAAGELGVQMGDLHDFAIEVQSPRVSVPVENTVMAGGYYALAFGGLHVVHDPLAAPPAEDLEQGAGEVLYTIAADFLERWNQTEKELADMLRLALARPIVSEVMVGTVHQRTLLFGQPQEVVWRGAFVDADLRVSEVVAVVSEAHQARRTGFRQLSALAGSMAEGDVLQSTLDVESVSAAKLIQLARMAAVPVREIDAGNLAVTLPALATAEVVKTEISDAIRQGWHAMTPERDFRHQLWRGIGYVLHDPTDGAAGYFISGGLAGGMTAEEWAQSHFKDTVGKPYAPPPNTDPLSAASIQIAPMTDGQDGVVGKPLPEALVAWVRDRQGKPVQGATVTFRVLTGGGDFDGSQTFSAQTDSLGLATANPTLGKKTSTAPFYVRLHEDDEHVTQIGLNQVTAAVATASGPLDLALPFEAYGLPDVPHHIVKLLGDGSSALAGTKGNTMLARVEDEHGNPVSNVPLEFTVFPAIPRTGSLPTLAKNLQLIPLDPPCSNPTPVLGECSGTTELVVLTSISGAGVDPILGNTEGTEFQVLASVDEGGLDPQLFKQFSLGDGTFSPDGYRAPRFVMNIRELVNDDGALLNATKVGTTFKRPLETVLYLLQDDYLLEKVSTTCPSGPPDPACYRIVWLGTTRARPINNARPGSLSFATTVVDAVTVNTSAETASVTFTVTQGGGTTDPAVQNLGAGRFATSLTVGTAPMLNTVSTRATATLWVPYFDLYAGTVTPVLATLAPGQTVNGFDTTHQDPSGSGPAPIAFGVPTSGTHEVFGVRVTLQAPGRVRTNDDGVLTEDIALPYSIEPAEYRGEQADLDVFEVDSTAAADADGCKCKWIGLAVGSSKQGTGTATLFRGAQLDLSSSYRLAMRINRGSAAEFSSDKQNLVFLTGRVSFASYEPNPDREHGLLYDPPDGISKPVRGAQVYLVDQSGNLVEVVNTTEGGFYSFTPPPSAGSYTVKIGAALGEILPHVVVADNTDPNRAPYVVSCPVAWNPATTASVNAHMASGWNAGTKRYSNVSSPCAGAPQSARAAAPFAILDAIYQAETTVKRVDPDIEFPFLTVYWSPFNKAGSVWNPATGDITTSHFDESEAALYILGKEDADTDEYDSHVILHEWSHYFQTAFSRPGPVTGDHEHGAILDATAAFEEGFADAFGGMLFESPSPNYIDTSGTAQGRSFGESFDDDAFEGKVMTDKVGTPSGFCTVPAGTPLPTPCTWRVEGYYSETSVHEVLWDLFQLLGFEPMQQAVTAMKTADGFPTIFSFLHELRKVAPQAVSQIDEIAVNENINPGDEYGDPGAKLYTPVPVVITGGGEMTVTTAIVASNGRLLQAWDRVWDPTPAPTQPQSADDLARPTPCNYIADPKTPALTQPCASSNRLFDHVYLRFTVAQPGTYRVEVAPTVGTSPFDGGDVAFELFRAPGFRTTDEIDAQTAGVAETITLPLEPGVHLILVSSSGSAARFTVRVVQQ